MLYLVSACLLGVNCRYNGEAKPNADVVEFLKDKEYIAICPEQMSGLPTPRPASEIQDGDGQAVLKGSARIVNAEGMDVTDAFLAGAKEVLKVAKENRAMAAILKERSPSCGSQEIYNGSFNKELRPGMGVVAALLKEAGIAIFSEGNLPKTVDE